MGSDIKLEISNLCKSYKNHIIFDKASFSAEGGNCIALVGENGCGKSTLLNIIAGMLKADKGTVSCKIDGAEIPLKKSFDYISYVPQTNFLVSNLSAYDNLLFWYQGNRKKLDADIQEGFIQELGVNEYIERKISKMSAGMQKRVAIACALANKPKILLLDEVNASLDIICKLQIQKMRSSYAAAGNIVIFSTHEEGDIDACNKIQYINNSQITSMPVAPLKEIFKDKL